jgi:hypothetical protein
MSSSSVVFDPLQYWYGSSQGFRDASDYTLFKKRQAIRQVANEPVDRSILQSLQNRTSLQFSELNCRTGGCPGGFPRNLRLTTATPI